MPYLEIKLGPDTLLVPFVGRIDYVIGRLPKADIQLRDMKVSRMHTQLFIDSRGSAFVRDLGSSGGTYYGNQRMRKGLIAPMVDGTKIRIGDAKITYYDAEPPSNAHEPPSQSDPRGLVRTNSRPRNFEADVTVLAADRVDPDTHSGPAEPPPQIDPMVFADDIVAPSAPSAKQPVVPAKPASSASAAKPVSSASVAKPPARKRDTGIVEAPWDKREGAPGGPKSERKLTVPPPTGGIPSPAGGQRRPPSSATGPAMPTSGYDETGAFHDEPAAPASPPPRSPLPPRVPGAAPASPPVSPLPPRSPASPPPARPAPATVNAGDHGDAFRDDSGDANSEDAFGDTPDTPDHSPFVISTFSGSARSPMGDRDDTEKVEPKLGMPTVRLEKPAFLERQAGRKSPSVPDEILASEGDFTPKIPTASIEPPNAKMEIDEPESAPMIGVPPATAPSAGADVATEDDELTDEQIAEYLGGSASGRYGPVNFDAGRILTSDTEDPPVEDDVPKGDEVAFHVSRVDLDAPDEFDIDDELPAQSGDKVVETTAEEASQAEPANEQYGNDQALADEAFDADVPADMYDPAAETGDIAAHAPSDAEIAEDIAEDIAENTPAAEPPVVEATTAKLRATTLLNVEPVEDPAVEAAVSQSTAPDAAGAVPGAPVAEDPREAAVAPEEIPNYDKRETPAPVVREGASQDRAFQPRKTRKLMKRRTAALDKSTDKTPERDQPVRGEPTRVLEGQTHPLGAKTMFVPKPENITVARPGAPAGDLASDNADDVTEDETGKSAKKAPHADRKLDSMGHGPGGDTVALPPKMLNELRDEISAPPAKAKTEPHTIGESPTVRSKQADDADDGEEEFILDDNYAFFTPPPPTRKGAYKKPPQEELLDANDFLGESEKLPPEKKAKATDDPDTLVE